ncbi:heavy metal-associated isoprenylated plant protein 3-like [Rosa rugosa]|uniref:heavy metal-associated isoprenylated plant protein 3-like n=1 Tax=Rosa rugosa TaxID=74645 RepID=UPI002B416578|nr:heavy metal-associated isoprenylated plant protein 3-like [Rosa rugosa]
MKGFKKRTLKWFTTKKKKSLQWFQRTRSGKYEQVSVLREEPESNEKREKEEPEVCLAAELEFSMHCDHCAIDVRNCCITEKGVEYVVFDKEKKLVKVEGRFDLKKLIDRLRRKDKIVILIGKKMEETQEQGESRVQK